MIIEIKAADFNNAVHGRDIVNLLDYYACDPMGGGQPLSAFVKVEVVKQLALWPHALTLLAYVDHKAVGLANCFQQFSTFQCKPILNIHDLIVLAQFRGHGISKQLLQAAQERAIGAGCCKLSLEVLSNNHRAKSVYQKFGFMGYELSPENGKAEFWEKKLS